MTTATPATRRPTSLPGRGTAGASSVTATDGRGAAPDGHRRPALPALTGLRAVAAVWVVLFHYREEVLALAPPLAPLDTFMRAGYLGVDLFFALSGFILAYTYADRMRSFRWREARGFVRSRFARVWPVHVVALHVDLVIAVLLGTLGRNVDNTRRTADAYVENLAMVHYWVNDRPSFNSPAWSISAEWFAYLLAPLLFVLVARLRRRSTTLLLAALSYGVMLTIFATMALPNGNLENMFWVRILFEFVGGLLLCLAWVRGGARLGRVVWVLPAALVLAALVPAVASGRYWMAPALGLGVAALAAAPASGLVTRFLAWPGVVAAGEASYALYMVHWLFDWPVERATAWAAGNAFSSAVVLLGVVLALGTASWLVLTRVERPARAWLARPRGRTTRPAWAERSAAGESGRLELVTLR